MASRLMSALRHYGISLRLRDVPEPAKYLGFAGTIPFLGTAYAMTSSDPRMKELRPLIKNTQVTYSACILSFMGAVHWGLEMAHYGIASSGMAWQRYSLSVVPSLVAWTSLCMPLSACYITQIAAFNALLYGDLRAYSRRLVPAWYPGLRVYLTAIVSLSLGVSFAADAWQSFRDRSSSDPEVITLTAIETTAEEKTE